MKNYDQRLERFRKLLRTKGMVPDSVTRLEASEDDGADNRGTEDDRKPKERKVRAHKYLQMYRCYCVQLKCTTRASVAILL